MSRNCHVYSQEEIDFILQNNHLHIDDLVDCFNSKFGLNKSRSSIYKVLSRNGFKRDKQNYLTDLEICFIKNNFKKMKSEDFARLFNERFNREMSPKRLRIIANKKFGLKKSTTCTKDLIPVGTTRIRGGRPFIKIGEPNEWMPKNKYVYEKETGIDTTGLCIVALDGKLLNCEISNLVAIDNRTLGKANGHKLLSKDKYISSAGIELAKLLIIIEDNVRMVMGK